MTKKGVVQLLKAIDYHQVDSFEFKDFYVDSYDLSCSYGVIGLDVNVYDKQKHQLFSFSWDQEFHKVEELYVSDLFPLSKRELIDCFKDAEYHIHNLDELKHEVELEDFEGSDITLFSDPDFDKLKLSDDQRTIVEELEYCCWCGYDFEHSLEYDELAEKWSDEKKDQAEQKFWNCVDDFKLSLERFKKDDSEVITTAEFKENEKRTILNYAGELFKVLDLKAENKVKKGISR